MLVYPKLTVNLTVKTDTTLMKHTRSRLCSFHLHIVRVSDKMDTKVRIITQTEDL